MTLADDNLGEPEDSEHLRDEFHRDAFKGLTAREKHIPSKYLYDDEGSKLFQKITELSEYYPFAAELDILTRHGGSVAERLGPEPFNLVELGAGDGRKTKVLLSAFERAGLDFTFVVIDISKKAIRDCMRSISADEAPYPVTAIVDDYFRGLRRLHEETRRRSVALFLGSNIGNFPKGEDVALLRHLRSALSFGDHAFVGFDVTLNPDLLLPAYDDPAGVTRDFNLNLLSRINRELDADFEHSHFKHAPRFNAARRRMESYLQSTVDHTVSLKKLGTAIPFQKNERILIEYSYKYALEDIHALARSTGFAVVEDYSDTNNRFIDSLWQTV